MGIEKPVKSPEPWEEYGFVWGSKRSKKVQQKVQKRLSSLG